MNDYVAIDITEAAADWMDRLSVDDVPTEERQLFAEWLRRSPVHIAEFLHVSALRTVLSGTVLRHPDWVKDVIATAEESVVLMPSLNANNSQHVGENSNDEVSVLAQSGYNTTAFSVSRLLSRAAVVVLVSIFGAAWLLQIEEMSHIKTAVGEQRVVMLDDGSKLQLNTDSDVKINMTEQSREIELLRGELLVTVVKDPQRPFLVKTDKAIVKAIGTQFNVYRRSVVTEVTVVEGRVLVELTGALANSDDFSANTSLELDAGLMTLVAENQSKPTPIKVDRATAWTTRRLDFDNETAASVAAEFNRYNQAQIIVNDPVLAQRRITGIFDVNDPGALISLLGGTDSSRVQLINQGQ